EIRVDVADETLVKYKLGLPRISDAIHEWMVDIPGGSVRTGVGNINVRTMGVEERSGAIRQIVIRANPDGSTLRLGDIATVREYYVDEQLITRFSTKDHSGPSASMTVFRVGDQDAVKIAEMVRAYTRGRLQKPLDRSTLNLLLNPGTKTAYEMGVNNINPLPPKTDLATHTDLARFIEGRLDLLLRNAMWGAVLVFGTLLLFLNWRVALWVGVGLVTAICGTLMIMSWTGISLNLLTMFGLIVVMGLLVDDAIVVAENIQARHDRAEPSLEAAIKGTEEVFWPVVATVMTSIVAFLPLTFVKGSIGDLLGALPMVVACALAMSLVESLLILPSHMGHSLVNRDKQTPTRIGTMLRNAEAWRDRIIFEKIVPAYARLLKASLHYRYISVSVAIALVIMSVSMFAGGRLIFNFLPPSDAETVVIDVRMPIGTALEETRVIVEEIERIARLQKDEVVSISTLIGDSRNLNTNLSNGGGTHLAQMFMELYPVEERTIESSQVIDKIRIATNELAGVDSISFTEISGGMNDPDISIAVKGDDTEDVNEVVARIEQGLAEFEGVFGIVNNNYEGQREVQISLKPGAAALGFTVSDVALQVRGALFGFDAHVFSAQREDIDVRVRLDESSRRNLYAIENMRLISPMGNRVPLSEIAELKEATSYSTINRVDRKRAVTVVADTITSISPESIMPQLQPLLDQLEIEYPGVELELVGRQRQMAKAFGSLPIGFLTALILIYVILAWLFSSYTQPIAVMLAIPFSLIGVIWGHWIMGYEVTFLSMIGFVAVSGIVVNDSLILVQFYNVKRDEGMNLADGLIEAGRARLRPIFLTTITTVLGLTPLMLEQSFQAKFLIPMAISIAFGLISATGLILLVLPCFMVIVDDIKAAAYYLWNGVSRPTEAFGKNSSALDLEVD
ncbi:MAG: efflux RND transporter permease subunit, partial [Planctomycetota bacterium]|nr:efflux RND transporter permease subunit [Planctomycetota bacterium]